MILPQCVKDTCKYRYCNTSVDVTTPFFCRSCFAFCEFVKYWGCASPGISILHENLPWGLAFLALQVNCVTWLATTSTEPNKSSNSTMAFKATVNCTSVLSVSAEDASVSEHWKKDQLIQIQVSSITKLDAILLSNVSKRCMQSFIQRCMQCITI